MMAEWSAFLEWSYENREHIVAITTLVGFPLAVVALFLTFKQALDAKRALQAGNTYEIQKEAREIIGRLTSDENFREYITPSDTPLAASVIRGAETQLALLFHFYLSVYRQAKAGGITKALISSMGKDFRDFFATEQVQNFFEAKKKRGDYDAEFDQMVEYWFRKSG